MNYEKIGNLIKKKRIEKNLTQQDLADKLHVTNRAISKWERGVGAPDISFLKELSNILGISERELLTGDENKSLNKISKLMILVCSIIAITVLTLCIIISRIRLFYLFLGGFSILIAYIIFIIYEKEEKKIQTVTYILLVAYFIFLLSTIFYTKLFYGNTFPEKTLIYNIKPFSSIIEAIYLVLSKTQNFTYFIDYVILDFILFLPLSLLLPILFPKKITTRNFIIICLLISLIKELLQLIFNTGIFDVDDIILNVFGAYLFFLVFKRIKR